MLPDRILFISDVIMELRAAQSAGMQTLFCLVMKENTIEINGFHAHIYFDTASREAAAYVREGLGANFDVRLGRWHEKPIGPHPLAMYQVAFSPEQFGKVVPWLMQRA